MGLYNMVVVSKKCSACGHPIEQKVQFKYGHVYQHEYKVGDEIIWDKKNVGDPKIRHVVVDGITEKCPICEHWGDDYEVWIRDGKIVDVRPASGIYDFSKSNFMVIE